MAEKEYIERGALIRQISLQANRSSLGEFSPPHLSYGDMLALVKDSKAADVVEVVRCGQCKHWKINPCNLYGGYCRYCDSAKIDHFCGYGERKEKTT